MSYTPPSGNAVAFVFDQTETYAPPAGSAVDFVFDVEIQPPTTGWPHRLHGILRPGVYGAANAELGAVHEIE